MQNDPVEWPKILKWRKEKTRGDSFTTLTPTSSLLLSSLLYNAIVFDRLPCPLPFLPKWKLTEYCKNTLAHYVTDSTETANCNFLNIRYVIKGWRHDFRTARKSVRGSRKRAWAWNQYIHGIFKPQRVSTPNEKLETTRHDVEYVIGEQSRIDSRNLRYGQLGVFQAPICTNSRTRKYKIISHTHAERNRFFLHSKFCLRHQLKNLAAAAYMITAENLFWGLFNVHK